MGGFVGGPIYTPASGTVGTPKTRRERRRRRERLRRSYRKRLSRRRWALVLALACIPGVLSLQGAGEQVSRVERPLVEAQPVPPLATGSLETRIAEVSRVYPGLDGIAIFSPGSGESVKINAGRRFRAASLAKLPVLLALYKSAARGELSLIGEISIRPSDRRRYGSGVLHRYPAGYSMTLRECAGYLIKESDNTAWAMLERRLGREKIAAELRALGAEGTDYARSTTTPQDVLLMLRAIADPGYTNPELSREMLELMTDTAYEDRLPRPLPRGTRVAHKVGTWKDTFSDAGLVLPKGAREPQDGFFIVVITRGAAQSIAEDAIRTISRAAYNSLSGGRNGGLAPPPAWR